jgi:peptidoglycan/LPS O-acetylase OafA/YrhL
MSIFQSYQPHFLYEFGRAGLNISLWTIPIELEFYLLLPVLYRVLRPHRRSGNALILIVLLASLTLQLCGDLLRLTLLPYLWMFLLGVLIQRNWHALRGKLMGRAHWWFLGYLFVCMLARLLHIGVGGNDINPIFLLPLAGLVISFAMSVRGLSERVLRQQDVSYGLYIYHALVIQVMRRLGLPSVMVTIAISLAIAVISWIFVERPFLIRKRGSLRTTRTGPVYDVGIR